MKNLAADTGGATSIEYALMVSLIAMVIITTITTLGQTLFGFYNEVISSL